MFVDSTEQGIAANKARGITGPGWWLYETYTTAAGDTRHKAECLAFVHATAAAAGDDADDTIVADAAASIAITAQPANSTSSSGAGTFTLTTSATGTLAPLLMCGSARKHLGHAGLTSAQTLTLA